MNFSTILLLVVLIIVVYVVIKFSSDGSTSLTNTMHDGQTETKIAASDLPAGNNTSNYTYSIWFYINDWNYKFGSPKTVFTRESSSGDEQTPSVVLAPMENNLNISVSVFPENDTHAVLHTCNVENVQLQKWVNLIVSLNGRSLDVYIDGKLVRTCVLPGVAKVNANYDVLLTPEGGFDGFTSSFKYLPEAINPQQAYDIYKEGYGGGPLGGFFEKYKIKVAYLVDNEENTSFEI